MAVRLKYRNRFSKFPRPVSEMIPPGSGLHGWALGQVPTTRDVINSYPMPILPADGEQVDPVSGLIYPSGSPVIQPAAPGVPTQAPRANLPIWLYPSVNWENIDQLAYALLPAIGSTVTIISFTVPIGRNGIINKVATNFVGGGWVEGTGDVVWKVLIDGTPPPASTSYDSIFGSLGSPAQPVGIAGFRIFENQTLTVVAFNNPGGPDGGVVVAGQRVGARILGYLYPRELEPEDTWV
jgi:hypothetical protein